MEKTLTEERCRYQNLLSEHLHLEEQHRDLREEMNLANVRRALWITAASSHLATDCVTPFTCRFFFLFHVQSASQSGHQTSNSGYSSTSSELSQSLGSTEDEDDDSPVQLEVWINHPYWLLCLVNCCGWLISGDQCEPCYKLVKRCCMVVVFCRGPCNLWAAPAVLQEEESYFVFRQIVWVDFLPSEGHNPGLPIKNWNCCMNWGEINGDNYQKKK